MADKDSGVDLVLVQHFEEVMSKKFEMESRRLKLIPSRCQDDDSLAHLHRWPIDRTRDRASSFHLSPTAMLLLSSLFHLKPHGSSLISP
jgi:hypothetical protein